MCSLTHPAKSLSRFFCSAKDKDFWRRSWCQESTEDEPSRRLAADRMENLVGCLEVTWKDGKWSQLVETILRAWCWMWFLLFFSFLVFPFSQHQSLSRNVYGGVRQAKHSTTLHHRQRPTASNPCEEVNLLVSRPAAIKDSNTSQQHKFATVSLVQNEQI